MDPLTDHSYKNVSKNVLICLTIIKIPMIYRAFVSCILWTIPNKKIQQKFPIDENWESGKWIIKLTNGKTPLKLIKMSETFEIRNKTF